MTKILDLGDSDSLSAMASSREKYLQQGIASQLNSQGYVAWINLEEQDKQINHIRKSFVMIIL